MDTADNKLSYKDLRDLVLAINSGRCRKDHHGYCQTHWNWYLSDEKRDVCVIKLLTDEKSTEEKKQKLPGDPDWDDPNCPYNIPWENHDIVRKTWADSGRWAVFLHCSDEDDEDHYHEVMPMSNWIGMGDV